MKSVPGDTVCLADYERHFHKMVDPAIAAYISGPAADGFSRARNRDQFQRYMLMPKVLADLREATAASTLFGVDLAYPIILAPTAYHQLVDPHGEVATAHAAGLTKTWMTVSLLSSVSLEQIAASATAPLWFQLYLQADRAESLVLARRAEEAGYAAIVVTVDAPVTAMRNEQQRAGFVLPPSIRPVNLDGLTGAAPVRAVSGSPVFQGMLRQSSRWEDIAWLREQCRLPILLKGVLNAEDAERAIALGIDGIIVSNHGGRVLDSLPSALDVLPAICGRVAGRIPVIADGGIRRGTDIVKALALGARAVLVGEPVLHALAVGGADGLAHMLTILQTEFEAAMAVIGCATLADIDHSVLLSV
ncbi:alpha-hydroxy acid oxidase [Rhizobium helianthi]|uniref:Alpha-hydroxy acid oxidase n=1 Tax=Rhizobium helianthi TaxID=1132695 RepID=A0ABW4LZV4_9HYPH